MNRAPKIVLATYWGPHDRSLENACIVEIRRRLNGKRLVKLPFVPNVSCRFRGRVRILRAWNPGPLVPICEWLNRVDVGYAEN